MKIALTLIFVASLAACSSAPRKPDYECPLDDVAAAKCSTVEQAYSASRTMKNGENRRIQSVFDRRVQQPSAAAAEGRPFFNGQPSNYPEPGQTGMPVFQQPKVMRAWVAPYVDADGNLRSGEYTYFATPGQWNYGEMKKPGSASGMFEPARPDKLGFNPVAPVGTAKAPPKPAEGATAAAPGSAPRAAQDPVSTITQPYQRLPTN